MAGVGQRYQREGRVPRGSAEGAQSEQRKDARRAKDARPPSTHRQHRGSTDKGDKSRQGGQGCTTRTGMHRGAQGCTGTQDARREITGSERERAPVQVHACRRTGSNNRERTGRRGVNNRAHTGAHRHASTGTHGRACTGRRAHAYPHGGVRARVGWGGLTNNRTKFRRELHAHPVPSNCQHTRGAPEKPRAPRRY